jgi:hypothetical protein
MPKVLLIFNKIIQDSREFGSNNQHTVSRVFFDLRIGANLRTDFSSDIKQRAGADNESDPLEVSVPQSLANLVDYSELRTLVEQYFHASFGSAGSAFQIGPGTDIRMMHNIVNRNEVAEIEFIGRKEESGW